MLAQGHHRRLVGADDRGSRHGRAIPGAVLAPEIATIRAPARHRPGRAPPIRYAAGADRRHSVGRVGGRKHGAEPLGARPACSEGGEHGGQLTRYKRRTNHPLRTRSSSAPFRTDVQTV